MGWNHQPVNLFWLPSSGWYKITWTDTFRQAFKSVFQFRRGESSNNDLNALLGWGLWFTHICKRFVWGLPSPQFPNLFTKESCRTGQASTWWMSWKKHEETLHHMACIKTPVRLNSGINRHKYYPKNLNRLGWIVSFHEQDANNHYTRGTRINIPAVQLLKNLVTSPSYSALPWDRMWRTQCFDAGESDCYFPRLPPTRFRVKFHPPRLGVAVRFWRMGHFDIIEKVQFRSHHPTSLVFQTSSTWGEDVGKT